MDKSLMLSELIKHYSNGSESDFANKIGVTPQTITNWKNRKTFNIDKIYTNCENISADWLISCEGEMLKTNNSILISAENNIGIPLIPLDAMAGFGTGTMQIMDYDTERYIVPEFTELNTDFMIRVKGSSMYPKYNSGDIVACKKLPLDTFFQWNKVYVLDTIQGAMIKRIHQSEKEGYITCVSDNQSYKPFDISLEDVYSLALVVGVIRLE